MNSELLVVNGDPIVFADHATDFSPAPANDLRHGAPTNAQLSLAGLPDGSARESAKANLGTTWADAWLVSAALEFAATPTARNIVRFFWASSFNATPANGNPGGVSGSDAGYLGYSSNLLDSIHQLHTIGTFVVTADVTPTVQVVMRAGLLFPKAQYGSLVVLNESGAALHADDVEMHVVITPVKLRNIQI